MSTMLLLSASWCQPNWGEEGPGWMTSGQAAAAPAATTSKTAKSEEPTIEQEKTEKPEKSKPEGESKAEDTRSEGEKEGEAQRRGKPQPLDDVFPVPEYPGPLIGVGGDAPLSPLTKALWDAAPGLKDANIRVYGWIEPSYNASTSNHSTFPLSYAIYANKLELNEGVIRIERVPDTVQTDRVDYGFRLTNLYGVDYRFTTAQGIFSNQLLKDNSLYGYDPVEAYFQLYLPKVADGMLLTLGRYISPAELEAPLSPLNFLVTHSLMNTAVPATFTGVKAEVKLDDTWSLMGQITAGGDIAPWNSAARVNGGFMVRWVADNNKDSVWAGINSIDGANFNHGHDQVNEFVGTYSHKFSDSINTLTEAYYEFVRNGLMGGTVNSGPPYPWYAITGAGSYLPGTSGAVGFANYLNFRLSGKDYLSFRTDYLNDPRGERTGYPAAYGSLSLGWVHNFSQLFIIRPEIRTETCFTPGVTPYENGTRKSQTGFNLDAIVHF